jgi:hypothetical protein
MRVAQNRGYPRAGWVVMNTICGSSCTLKRCPKVLQTCAFHFRPVRATAKLSLLCLGAVGTYPWSRDNIQHAGRASSNTHIGNIVSLQWLWTRTTLREAVSSDLCCRERWCTPRNIHSARTCSILHLFKKGKMHLLRLELLFTNIYFDHREKESRASGLKTKPPDERANKTCLQNS